VLPNPFSAPAFATLAHHIGHAECHKVSRSKT
jgi:hypothetical protein